MTTRPPEQIYLQCHEDDGNLLNLVRDDVTWCVDQINENNAIYILATPELASLLEYLAEGIDCLAPAEDGVPTPKTDEARALAAKIKEALDEH